MNDRERFIAALDKGTRLLQVAIELTFGDDVALAGIPLAQQEFHKWRAEFINNWAPRADCAHEFPPSTPDDTDWPHCVKCGERWAPPPIQEGPER